MGGRGPKILATARPTFDGGTKTLTFAVPAAATRGDLLVVLLVRNGAVTGPAGWTAIEPGFGASSLFLEVWGRLVDIDEPPTAAWSSASSQELQGQLLLFRVGNPAVILEGAQQAAFTADAAPDTPDLGSEQATSLFVAVFSAGGAVAFTPPAGFTSIDSYSSAVLAARTIMICSAVAGELAPGLVGFNGPLEPGPAASAPASTGRMWSLVMREGPPLTPPALTDPVPGNIGLLPF